MTHLRTIFSATLVAATTACASAGAPGAPAPTSAGTPAATSVPSAPVPAAPAVAPGGVTFSDAQADRGRDTFRAGCTECHDSSQFSNARFGRRWNRRTAGSLYSFIQTSMPETAPGSLTPKQTVELVAYIMRMNGFEPGAGELTADRAVLDQISLARMRNE